MAQTLLSKQAAAQRQLDAAIRMLFLHCEDLVAVHTVAAAARGIVRDLAERRGVGEVFETEAVLKMFYQQRFGLDPKDIAIARDIRRRADAIEKDGRTKAFRNRASNFLKHADRDNKASLDSEQLNPLAIIINTMQLWMNLNLDLTLEMSVFGQWYVFVSDASGPAYGKPFEFIVAFGRKLLVDAYGREERSAKRFRDDTSLELAKLAAPALYTALE